MEVHPSLQNWLAMADDEDHRPALIRVADHGDAAEVARSIELPGVQISDCDASEILVDVSRTGLQSLTDLIGERFSERLVVSIDPPPGTGEPSNPGRPLPD